MKRLLAEGASAEVFLAVDEQLGRRVALKLVKPGTLDQRAIDRFIEEARTTARFSHPHIVTIFGAGRYNGRPYLALEFLDGETLRERLTRVAQLAEREAMRTCRSIAEGVAEAHRHGVVHSDLKPENVVLAKDGRLRVVDFGLARLMGERPAAASGTPAYMAPERWTGAPPGPAMDVWALGVILYELLEGARPIPDDMLFEQAYSPEPVELGPRGAAASCRALLLRCLALEPAGRPSAEDVASELSALLDAHTQARDAERSPFRGLAAFTEADAADFIGRGAEVDQLTEQLRGCGAVTVVGPSGVGKSSFVQAGLVPRLREGGEWTVLSMRPGAHPCLALARALTGGDGRTAELATSLARRPAALGYELVTLAHGGRALLVVDQLEECFTLAAPDEAAPFLRCLATASADERWRVVLTVRDDFLPQFAAQADLRPLLAGVLVLAPMGRAALQEVVRRPLARVGAQCDREELPARIAADLEGRAAALPLLQFACQALWERRDVAKRQLLTAEYDAIGGASGALAEHAQRFLASLPPEERTLTRALLLRLVNADGTRRPRAKPEVLEGLPPAAARVLDLLITRRLLTATQRPDAEAATTVELAHEALAESWPELKRWLQETSEDRAFVDEVEKMAQLWDQRGRRDDETWAGDALAGALRRARSLATALPTLPARFLEASVARDQRLRRRRTITYAATVGGLTALTIAMSIAALAFREKERQAIEQQEQIRLAAADVGRFELVLEPFDWDAERLVATSVPASSLAELDWALAPASRESPNQWGAPYDAAQLKRSGRRVGDALREQVEVSSAPAWLEVRGRGAGCGPSWVLIRHLPGYADRGAPRQLRLGVPTCQATRAGMLPVSGGPVRHGLADGGFELHQVAGLLVDKTEAPGEAFELYERLRLLTGDARPPVPPLLAQAVGPRLPVVGVDALTAERFCRFFGKRLPHADEWQRAASGDVLDDPAPQLRRSAKCQANLEGADDGFEVLAPVCACEGDVSPMGLCDMVGNVQEWTADEGVGSFASLRVTKGATWAWRQADPTHSVITAWNSRPSGSIDFSTGVRCALGD